MVFPFEAVEDGELGNRVDDTVGEGSAGPSDLSTSRAGFSLRGQRRGGAAGGLRRHGCRRRTGSASAPGRAVRVRRTGIGRRLHSPGRPLLVVAVVPIMAGQQRQHPTRPATLRGRASVRAAVRGGADAERDWRLTTRLSVRSQRSRLTCCGPAFTLTSRRLRIWFSEPRGLPEGKNSSGKYWTSANPQRSKMYRQDFCRYCIETRHLLRCEFSPAWGWASCQEVP